MTIDQLALRVGAALALGGIVPLVAAVCCWATVGDGDAAVHSVHAIGGWILAVFGMVMIGMGIAIASAVPSKALTGSSSAGS